MARFRSTDYGSSGPAAAPGAMRIATDLERLTSALSDRYVVEREIGCGGAAKVYLARDLKHGREVAIKVLRPELASMVGAGRFLREIQIEARLQHINILPLHDSGESDGFVYYVMPYVQGEPLRARLDREQQLPFETALRIVREIAEALAYAHAHDVIHRDVKPENILLSNGHAVLADFGIARAITAAGRVRVTDSGHVVGTPAYMSPEQATGEDGLDGRSDIYSLACVLYEMLAGEPPYAGRNAKMVMVRHMLEPPPSLRTLRPSVPPHVERAIEKALAKAPPDRFADVGEFVRALDGSVPASDGTPGVHDASAPLGPGGIEAVVRPRPAAPAWRRAIARLGGRRAIVLLGGVVPALLIGRIVWSSLFSGGAELDMRRVVVFPLSVVPEDSALVGEDIATLIGHALEATGRLSWIDGWFEVRLAGVRAPAPRTSSSRARELGAGYFVQGRVTLGKDTVRIVLELRDTRRNAVVATGAAAGVLDEAWKQRETRKALEPVIAALVPMETQVPRSAPGDSIEVSQGMADFLEGERLYRRSRFAEALARYRAAVAADSQLVVAAIKGARAAFWIRETDQAGALIDAALSRSKSLTPIQLHFVHGLEDYLHGRPDSAIVRFRLALDIVPEWWIQARLGEVYMHMLPRESPLDSLAQAEFAEVHRRAPELSEVLYHLIEFAALDGRVERADSLLESYRAVEPDSSLLATAELMVSCVENGPGSIQWRAALTRAEVVFGAAQSLARAGRQPECAAAAYRALLAHESASGESEPIHQFGAVLGLQSLLVAQGRFGEARRLLVASSSLFGRSVGDVYLLNTISGADMRAAAMPAVEAARRAFRAGEAHYGGDEPNALYLWFLGVWEAWDGQAEAARAVADSLAASAARNGRRLDRLLAASLEAHATLAEGDSARALELYRRLTPTKPAGREWYPWESLGYEQLQLARLLFARGEYREALRVAGDLDAPARPVLDLIHLPASLELRLRAARALGDEELEARLEGRLASLGREDLVRFVGSP